MYSNYGDLRSSYVIIYIYWFGFDTIVHISPTTLPKFPCLPILWLSGPGWSLCRLCQLFLCIRAAAFSGGWWWNLPVAMHTEAFRIIADYIDHSEFPFRKVKSWQVKRYYVMSCFQQMVPIHLSLFYHHWTLRPGLCAGGTSCCGDACLNLCVRCS